MGIKDVKNLANDELITEREKRILRDIFGEEGLLRLLQKMNFAPESIVINLKEAITKLSELPEYTNV